MSALQETNESGDTEQNSQGNESSHQKMVPILFEVTAKITTIGENSLGEPTEVLHTFKGVFSHQIEESLVKIRGHEILEQEFNSWSSYYNIFLEDQEQIDQLTDKYLELQKEISKKGLELILEGEEIYGYYTLENYVNAYFNGERGVGPEPERRTIDVEITAYSMEELEEGFSLMPDHLRSHETDETGSDETGDMEQNSQEDESRDQKMVPVVWVVTAEITTIGSDCEGYPKTVLNIFKGVFSGEIEESLIPLSLMADDICFEETDFGEWSNEYMYYLHVDKDAIEDLTQKHQNLQDEIYKKGLQLIVDDGRIYDYVSGITLKDFVNWYLEGDSGPVGEEYVFMEGVKDQEYSLKRDIRAKITPYSMAELEEGFSLNLGQW